MSLLSANLLSGTSFPSGAVDNQSTITSSKTLSSVRETVESFVQSSGINLQGASWLALTDKISSEFSTVTLAQVQNGSISDISAKLSAYQSIAEELAVTASPSSEFAGLMADLGSLEKELSFLIGQASIQKTASFTVSSSELVSQPDVVSSLGISNGSNEKNEILQVEISNADYLNGFHFADGCPICEAAALGVVSTGATDLIEPTEVAPASGPSTLGGNVTGATTWNTTGTNYIDSLVSGYIWDIDPGESLTYSFYDSTVGLSSSEAGWTPYELGDEESNMRTAYETWDVYLPFYLDEVDESGSTVGELRAMYNDITATNTASGSAAQGAYPNNFASGGNAYYHVDGEGNDGSSLGDGTASSLATNLSFAVGTYGFYTALHEIGHTLGLKHPFGTGTVLPSADEDVRNSVMAYSSVDDLAISYDGSSWSVQSLVPITPMVYDIAAVENAYGSISDTNATDTVFSFTDPELIQSIVDSGGTDTIDVSGMEQRSIIDLTPGAYSSIGYWTQSEQVDYYASTYGFSTSSLNTFFDDYDAVSSVSGISNSTVSNGGVYERQNNVGIAYSAVIENVIGSNGDDEITGNSSDNEFTGGLGDDTLDGGTGSDTAIYSGLYAQYTIIDNNDGTYTVADSTSDRDGTDTIQNIEALRFTDRTYSLSGSGAGTSTVNSGYTEILTRGSSKISSGGSYLRSAVSTTLSGLSGFGGFGGGLVGPHGFASLAQLLASQGNSSGIASAANAAKVSFNAVSQALYQAQTQSVNRQLDLISSNTRNTATASASAADLRVAYTEVSAELVANLLS